LLADAGRSLFEFSAPIEAGIRRIKPMRSISRYKCGILACSIVLAVCTEAVTQSTTQAKPSQPIPAATVEVRHQKLFEVRGVLSFSAEARAAAISKRIQELSKDVTFKPESLKTVDSTTTTDIVANDLVIMSVTDQDAQAAGESRQVLAQHHAERIRAALVSLRKEYSLKSLLLGVFYAAIATSFLLIILWAMRLIFPKVYRTLDSWRGTRIRSLKIQKFELLPAYRITSFAIGLTKLFRFAFLMVILYLYASIVLSSFPWTRGYAGVLVSYVLSPLNTVGNAIVTTLPNVFFIIVITFVSVYVTKFVKVIFTELRRGTIKLPNFYPEWAQPTYKIVRFLIISLTLIVVFPYLPGSQSPAFRGVSIFLGILFSFGSTSAVANVVAGVILTYMRPFKIGDRVKIADTMGDVTERTLLITRIRTIKNVEITIANAMVLGSHIFNFSASAGQGGLILHTTVTIGYDAPWRTVHKLLIDAALATEHILPNPQPFIFQTALDDFYVRYELNAYTDRPSEMAKTYSDLHQNIQDKFNEAGVEITSPHYSSVRDGNEIAIPAEYRRDGYTAPVFRLGMLGELEKPAPKEKEKDAES
jgi:small-conductance mechanosensitive channel